MIYNVLNKTFIVAVIQRIFLNYTKLYIFIKKNVVVVIHLTKQYLIFQNKKQLECLISVAGKGNALRQV